MDTGLDENEAELGVLVLSVALEVLAHVDGLLDKVVEVLGDLGGKTVGLEDSKDLVSSGELDLRHTVGITENDANSRGSKTLASVSDDLFLDLLNRELEPAGSLAGVGNGRSCHSLASAVHATHLAELLKCVSS